MVMKPLLEPVDAEHINSDGQETEFDALSVSGSASEGSSSLLEDVCMEVPVIMGSAELPDVAVATESVYSFTDGEDQDALESCSEGSFKMHSAADTGKAECQVIDGTAKDLEEDLNSTLEMVPVLRWDAEVGSWVRDHIGIPAMLEGIDDVGGECSIKCHDDYDCDGLAEKCFGNAQVGRTSVKKHQTLRAEAACFTPAASVATGAGATSTKSGLAFKEFSSLRVDAPAFHPVGLGKADTVYPRTTAAAYMPEGNCSGFSSPCHRTRLSSKAEAFVPWGSSAM